MEDNGRKTWYDGSMKKGKDPRGGLRRVFCYSISVRFYEVRLLTDGLRRPYLSLHDERYGRKACQGDCDPLESPGVNSGRKPDVLCAFLLATVQLTRLSRAWRAQAHCFHALCVLRVPRKNERFTLPPNFRLQIRSVILSVPTFL